MTTQATLAQLKPKAEEEIKNLPSVGVGLTSLQGFELAQRAAKLLAASTLVPKDYQGNMPNCVIALNMAARVGADPLMVMQNLVIVHGRPTWSAQFLISTVNTCGRFSALRYEFFGQTGTDSWGCRAWAIEKATGEKLVGTDVTIAIAKAEGWYGKNGSKWKTIPQQMLMYRAGSWWTRAYAPELSMGLHTVDEMLDVYDAEKQDDGTYTVSLDDLKPKEADPVIDAETGEIQPQAATPKMGHAEPPPVPEIETEGKPVFDINAHTLTTQSGAKQAATELLKVLEAYAPEERGGVFLQSSGVQVLEACGRQGLGMMRGKFTALGIQLPQGEAE